MPDPWVERWSRFLIFFILAVLPLERIPSLDVAVAGSNVTVRLGQVAALVLVAINLPTLFGRRADLLRTPWRWIWLFLLVMGVSTLFALDPKRAVLVTAFTGFAVVLAWTISLRFEHEQTGRYAGIILASAVAACAFGFYQFFGDLAGLPQGLTGLRYEYTKVVFGFPRVQSTGLEPLYFANYLLLPISIAAALYLFRQNAWLWPLAPVLACLWVTLSRGAFGAVVVVLVVLAVFGIVLGRARRVAALMGVVLATVGLALGAIASGSALERAAVPNPSASEGGNAEQDVEAFSRQSANFMDTGRATTRTLAVRAFEQRPLLGLGPGNFGELARGSMPELFPNDLAIVNNEPLELLAETGAIGFLFFALFALNSFWLAVRKLARDGVYAQPWLLGLLLCLVGYAVQYQTFSTLYITHVWVTIGLLLGYLLTSGTVRKEAEPRVEADVA